METSESVVAALRPSYASHARKFKFRTCLTTHLLLCGQVRGCGEQYVDGLRREGPSDRRVAGDSAKNRRRNLPIFR